MGALTAGVSCVGVNGTGHGIVAAGMPLTGVPMLGGVIVRRGGAFGSGCLTCETGSETGSETAGAEGTIRQGGGCLSSDTGI